MTRRLLRERMRDIWPDLAERRIVGIGYAAPLFAGAPSGPSLQLMPARQGVVHWPPKSANRATLIEDDHLPLADNQIERIVVCHALENTDNMRRVLRELWRVLAPEGELLVIVPHRRSLWALVERTPFGHGRPFTVGQLQRLLRDQMFEPMGVRGALYGWPGNGRLSTGLLLGFEKLGRRSGTSFAGVIMMVAKKRIESHIDGRAAEQARAYARA
jgi:SAM-dependent methyltransferase